MQSFDQFNMFFLLVFFEGIKKTNNSTSIFNLLNEPRYMDDKKYICHSGLNICTGVEHSEPRVRKEFKCAAKQFSHSRLGCNSEYSSPSCTLVSKYTISNLPKIVVLKLMIFCTIFDLSSSIITNSFTFFIIY